VAIGDDFAAPPLVFASLGSYFGNDASHLRLKNLDNDSIDAMVEEDRTFDGTGHGDEIVDLLAIEGMLLKGKIDADDFGSARTVYSGDFYDVLVSAPAPVGANPDGETLYGIDVTVVNTSGEAGYNPAGFNGSQDPWTGFSTLEGAQLHQQHIPGLLETATLDGPPNDIAKDIDTHFNFYANQVLPLDPPGDPDPGAPTETTAVETSDEPVNATGGFAGLAETDFGDRIFGNFGVLGGGNANIDGDGDPTTWTLLHISAKWGTAINMNFFITGVGGSEVIDGVFYLYF
jgi:hypothetical protein